MVCYRYVLIALLLAAGIAPARAAEAPGPGPVVEAFITALNGADPAPFSAVFAPRASITDTLGAFNWQGPDAPARYFAALQAEVKAVGWDSLQLAHHGAPTLMTKDGHAYDAVPLSVSYSVKGVHKQDEGIFVLTLVRAKAGWAITSAAWVYTRPPG